MSIIFKNKTGLNIGFDRARMWTQMKIVELEGVAWTRGYWKFTCGVLYSCTSFTQLKYAGFGFPFSPPNTLDRIKEIFFPFTYNMNLANTVGCTFTLLSA